MVSISGLWRLFSSVRLALCLILVITGLSLIGALLIQAPSGVAADPTVYSYWLQNVAEPKLGLWTKVLSALRLFDVFHSPWFLGAVALLVLNILICSLNRLGRLRMVLAGGPIKLAEEFYSASASHAALSDAKMTPSAASSLSTRIFRRHHYRVRTANLEGKIYLAADKNRYFVFGTYLGHLSLILLITGVLMGGFMGFRNTSFIIPEGTVREVGYGTGLSLRLESFSDEYYPDGMPKDYRSQVVVYQGGQEAKRGTIRVNYPMSYNGIRFYQSFFGPAASLQVKNSAGEVLYQDSVALPEISTSMYVERPAGSFSLPNDYEVYLVSPVTNTTDPVMADNDLLIEIYSQQMKLVASGKLSAGVPQKLADLEFTYLEKGKFSGFQVSRNPGTPLIWVAFALLLTGVSIVLYFPNRQVWAMVSPAGAGSRILLRSTSARNIGANTELTRLVKSMEAELRGRLNI